MALSVQIRALAQQLNENCDKEKIVDIKTQFLSLADVLEKKEKEIYLSNKEIDNILDEIDEKENKSKEDNDESKQWVSWVYAGLHWCLYHTFFIEKYNGGDLGKPSWVLLFSNSNQRGFPGAAYHLNTPHTKQDLEAIFDAIPKDLMSKYSPGYLEETRDAAKFFVKYKTAEENKNKILFDEIFDKLKAYGCWYNFCGVCSGGKVEKAVEYLEKYGKYIDFNKRAYDDGTTCLHKAVSGGVPMINWLIGTKKIDYNIKDYKGLTALDRAKKYEKWDVVETLSFASMSDKMRQKADDQVAKLNSNQGMVQQWFRFYKVDNSNSDEYKSMIKMIETLKTLIKERLPISDDLLLLCFNFEMMQNKNDPLQCSLWKSLYNTLNNTLRIPLNRRNWLWFKQYIFNSSLWFQKTDPKSGKLLYDLLVDMVSKQLKAQRDYLRPYINKLESETKEDETKDNDDDDSMDRTSAWERLKNYKEFIVTDNPEGLRQDECVEKGTHKELLPFPIRPQFTDDQLRKLDTKVKEFNCHHHYDVTGYLSKLVLVAHSLNDTFHDVMRLIFNIDPVSSSNDEDGVIYHQGPVKRLARSQAKAETDYASASYPTTAKIIDFIRCCLVYDNPYSLIKGVDQFIDAVNNESMKRSTPCCDKCGDKLNEEKASNATTFTDCAWCKKCVFSDHIIWKCVNETTKCKFNGYAWHLCVECADKQLKYSVCLKRILRLKNMFLDNKRENNGQWDLYKYADIKMGVLMEYDGQSMIVEVQFLLNFMLKAKGLGHGLYEIERNKDFISDVDKIRSLSASNGDIDEILRSAITNNDENILATQILNHAPVDLTKIEPKSKKGLLHIAAEKNNKKVFKFLLDTYHSDRSTSEFTSFINMKDGTKYSPYYHGYSERSVLHYSCNAKNPNPNLLRILLKYDELDVNIRDGNNETVFFKTCVWDKKNPKKREMYEMLKNDERTKEGWKYKSKRGGTMFFNAIKNSIDDVEFVKELWLSGLFKINDRNAEGLTVLMYSILWKKPKTTEFLLSIDGIDVNFSNEKIDSEGKTVIDYAILKKDKDIIMKLYNRKDFNWKSGPRNKLVLAVRSGDLEIIKLVMRLWPNIDVNGIDDDSHCIYKAIEIRNKEIFNYLLTLPNIQCDIIGEYELTPWLLCIDKGLLEFAQILYQRKDIDFYRKKKDKNALQMALKKQNIERYKLLIEWLKSIGFTESS